MKKKLHIFNYCFLLKGVCFVALFLLFHNSINAQCSGDITLSTQAEVDNFSCTTFTGNLTITGSGITNLDGLSTLTSVSGNLFIDNNTALTSISGFSNLTTIGDNFWISDNAVLTSIDGFSALNSVVDNFSIRNNAALTSIGGFSALATIDNDFEIRDNAALTSIDGFPALTTVVDNFYIRNNAALITINGFPALTTVINDIQIRNNLALTSINGFSSLTTVEDNFWIIYNDALTSLNGFSSLTTVKDDFWVSDNAVLTNIYDFPALTTVLDNLYIRDNAVLTNIDGFSALTFIGDNLYINDNSALTNIDGFSALTTIDDDLLITGNSALTSINGLSALTSITDRLTIIDNLSLDDLVDFCWLYDVLNNSALGGLYSVTSNGIDPTQTEIINGGPCPSPLPVELINFQVETVHEKEIQLTWQTASELNNMGFEVERSADGSQWEFLNSVEGNGTTNEIQSYVFTDDRPIIGFNYYRLKQLDLDGKYEYSDIRSVLIGSPTAADLQVFPNPNDGQFTLSLFKPAESDASIRIYGTEGNLIWEDYVKQSEGLGHWKKELNLASGKMYYVVSYVGDEVLSQKIIARSKK